MPPSPNAYSRFLRGVFVALLFATAVAFAGLIIAFLAVPFPPTAMTVSYSDLKIWP